MGNKTWGDEGWADQNERGAGASRGDLLLEGTGLSHFLITTNRSQFHMTSPTTHLGQRLYYRVWSRDGEAGFTSQWVCNTFWKSNISEQYLWCQHFFLPSVNPFLLAGHFELFRRKFRFYRFLQLYFFGSKLICCSVSLKRSLPATQKTSHKSAFLFLLIGYKCGCL